MKIGTLLHLEYKNPKTNKVQQFRSKIIEKNEKYLFIDYPIDKQTNKSVSFFIGMHLTGSYLEDDLSIYSFPTSIEKKVKLRIPALAIILPESNRIKRIQRREYVRIESAVDTAVHHVNSNNTPFVTVTNDISGGGISIILPKGNRLKSAEKLDVWLVLHMESEKTQYLNIRSSVIRVNDAENNIQKVSIKFEEIPSTTRQTIIQYCFEKQREERKKELL